ncbi:MAG: hypothetical protein V4754_07745 [Pseudomonadota bacterium]
MNIAKYMEAIFVVAAVVLGASSYAVAAIAPVHARLAPAAEVSMPVVHVSAKRLSVAEKARLAH